MSTATDLPQGQTKAPYQDSTVVTAKYELDGVAEDGSSDASQNQFGSGYTRNDQKDMHRMGKNQELMRMFRSFSTFSFTIMIQSTWEFMLLANYQGLLDGGMAGFFWSYIWTYAGFTAIVLSLAEMASMAPTSGGQYHWVSEFAPAKYQKILSYVTGWMSTMSWQGGVASGAFLVGTVFQSLISINNPSYERKGWQGTLFVFAIALFVFNLNIWCARGLPLLQNVLLVLHVFSFAAVVILLFVVGRVQSASNVFTQFSNGGGWSSVGLSLMIGQVNAVYLAICSDAAAHMSEEVKDAGTVVPRAMITSFVVNGVMGFIALIAFLFAIPNLGDALSDPSGYPWLYVMRSHLSDSVTTGVTVVVVLLALAGNTDFNASASRQAFALARDNGFPFSKWISRVHPKLHVPANAVALTTAVTLLLSLINIGSTVAFNAIVSLQLAALMTTYSVSIACVLYRRLASPETLPKARWSLGRFGPTVNWIGFLYSTFIIFWCFWPLATPVDAKSFNWAVLIFMTVLIGSLSTYFIRGRKNYVGPVALVNNGRVSGMA